MSGSFEDAADLCRRVLAGERRGVARAITLLESQRPEHREQAAEILDALGAHAGGAQRVGLTGSPGVGKSSFIETLGLSLVQGGHRVAVLAVDPSSPVSGGSILGDKTRMEKLAREPRAFIRPSPSGGALGGVAERTREAVIVCEAAGYDVVLIETVGVGQSELAVSSMVDLFCVLLQPGAGDELQGIKRGVLELADLLVVNKCDGEQVELAARTRRDYEHALQLLRPPSRHWRPKVLSASAQTGEGVREFWEQVLEHRRIQEASGERRESRSRQARSWLWRLVEEGVRARFDRDPRLHERLRALEQSVGEGRVTPMRAAAELLEKLQIR
ncbi:MAG: methylmalonyl Co-A mutase-associated GTPase MeaB [Myxococcota bacterium]